MTHTPSNWTPVRRGDPGSGVRCRRAILIHVKVPNVDLRDVRPPIGGLPLYKNIIIPVDLGHTERLQPMIDIARLLGGDGASVILINVVENLPAFVAAELPSDLTARTIEDARSRLEETVAGHGISAEIEVRSGHPATTILECANDRKADLIVIASHRPGFGDFLIGSTAARVVRHAQCSVHVVR